MHVALDLQAGGLERVVADLITHLDPSRFESHLLCLQYLGRHASPLASVATLHVADRQSRMSMIRPARLAAQIRDIDPDIVHTHSGAWYKTARAARMAGTARVVYTDHGRIYPEPSIEKWLTRRATRLTDSIVAVSNPLADYLSSLVPRYADRITVLHNGVDTQLYAPTQKGPDAQAELGVDASTPIIGSVGRFVPVKGCDLLINAYAILRTKLKPTTRPQLVLIGEGPERDRLASLIQHLDLDSHVKLLGWRTDINLLYPAFTLFTLASHTEGTSMSLLEAMSSGVCPIVTDVGGNRQVLGPRLHHRLVRPGDPMALAAAWLDGLCDSPKRQQDGISARRRICASFSLMRVVRRYEKLYEELYHG